MLKDSHAFSGFSVKDLDRAKRFYGDTLGLEVSQDEMGLILKLANGTPVFVYPKDNHEPATFTILNFPVDDIDKAVDKLSAKGIKFEEISFDNGAKTDERGVLRGKAAKQGPDIAWFKDPDGNFLSILED